MTLKHLALTLVFAPALVLAGCDGGGDTGGGDCANGDAPSFTSIDWSSCTHCHSSSAADRQAAPVDLNYDDYNSASAKGTRTAERVMDGTMPPTTSDGPALSAEAEAQIIDWSQCGTPQ
ncbi:MAG: hypothetical protein KC468_16830 [Myxococcales bacterium]|nr:hypothetical protein [Myxococcales bacterium]